MPENTRTVKFTRSGFPFTGNNAVIDKLKETIDIEEIPEE